MFAALKNYNWPILLPLVWVLPMVFFWNGVGLAFVLPMLLWAGYFLKMLERDHFYYGPTHSHFEIITRAYPRYIGSFVMLLLVVAYLFLLLALAYMLQDWLRFLFGLPSWVLLKFTMTVGLVLTFLVPTVQFSGFRGLLAWFQWLSALLAVVWVGMAVYLSFSQPAAAWPEPKSIAEIFLAIPLLAAFVLPLVFDYRFYDYKLKGAYSLVIRNETKLYLGRLAGLSIGFLVILAFGFFVPYTLQPLDLKFRVTFLPAIFVHWLTWGGVVLSLLVTGGLLWLLGQKFWSLASIDLATLLELDLDKVDRSNSNHLAQYPQLNPYLLLVLLTPMVFAMFYNEWDSHALLVVSGIFMLAFAFFFTVPVCLGKPGYPRSPWDWVFLVGTGVLLCLLGWGVFFPLAFVLFGAVMDLMNFLRSKENPHTLRYTKRLNFFQWLFYNFFRR